MSVQISIRFELDIIQWLLTYTKRFLYVEYTSESQLSRKLSYSFVVVKFVEQSCEQI